MDGCAVGDMEGWTEGALLATLVGAVEGEADSFLVGGKVKSKLGRTVGARVTGAPDGSIEGHWEGNVDGKTSTDGLLVGGAALCLLRDCLRWSPCLVKAATARTTRIAVAICRQRVLGA